MNELESYIRTHAADFDAAEPATGHEERFLARLDATPQAVKPERPAGRQGFSAFFRSRTGRAFAFALAAFAAALLLLRPGDPFRGAGNDPEAIYLAYMDEVSRIYEQVPPTGDDGRDDALESITEESYPFFLQLPEEYSPRKRAHIIKEYYSGLLAQARETNDNYR